jgi:hypothetical protein
MMRGTGKLSNDKPNFQELMIASNVLSDLRIHDEQAHKIIADAIANRLSEQRAGIANSLVGIGDMLKLDAGQREKLGRMIDLIRRGLELHLDDGEDDVRKLTSPTVEQAEIKPEEEKQ